MSLQRLRTDFRFAILSLFGVIAVAAILPFAVYRFARGDLLAGWVDLGILLSIGLSVAHVWRGGNQTVAAMFVVVATTAGCLWVALLLGLPGLLWMYPVLVSHYLLLDRRHAAVASAAAVGILLLHGGAFDSGLQKAMFLVSATVTAVFAFVFAQRTERQRQQLETLAGHDPLTGAFNRRVMERELPIALDYARRHRQPVALALLDLDHFKRVNDSEGHEAGDALLVELVRVVAAATRKSDRLFRYGGEEFVLLVPGADAAAIRALCESLRTSIARALSSGRNRVTVSFGAAVAIPEENAATWLARADAALYRAKHEGRDRVVMAEEEEGGVAAALLLSGESLARICE